MISSDKIQKSNRIKCLLTVDVEYGRKFIQSSFHKNIWLIEEILLILLSFEERVSLFGNLKVFLRGRFNKIISQSITVSRFNPAIIKRDQKERICSPDVKEESSISVGWQLD